jgi:hypothetical protein
VWLGFRLTNSKSASSGNFILRITKEEWYRQVFTIKRYYPGVPRRWEPGNTILLVHKADKEDSFVGYGVVERFVKRDLLPEEKRLECEKMKWRGELVFSELYMFEPPVPIKQTVLGGSRVRGRCLHGYPLTQEQAEVVLKIAEQKARFTKID